MLRAVAASRNKLKKQRELSSHSLIHPSMDVRKCYGDGVVEKVGPATQAQDDGLGRLTPLPNSLLI